MGSGVSKVCRKNEDGVRDFEGAKAVRLAARRLGDHMSV